MATCNNKNPEFTDADEDFICIVNDNTPTDSSENVNIDYIHYCDINTTRTNSSSLNNQKVHYRKASNTSDIVDCSPPKLLINGSHLEYDKSDDGNNNDNKNQHHSPSTSSVQCKSNCYNQLRQWIYCITIVNFDIEIGQSIECIFPSDTRLTEREISNICYLSFPDSNSGCMGDTQFHFRTKACAVDRPSFENYYKDFNKNCLQVLEVDKSYFYGFVYFRQVKDREAKRGYFQKSLMILTWFPFVSLFSKIMKILAPQYFTFGVASLEAACGDINRWPKPVTGKILNLPLFGTVTQVLIPDNKYNYSTMCQTNTLNMKRYSTSSLSLRSLSLLKLKKSKDYSDSELSKSESSPYLSNRLVINVSNDINIYQSLLPVISNIQLLWELVLTNEPLAVITHTPNLCSDVVFALVHSISPLKYGADYRPFFTIHDSEFKDYTSHKSPSPVILGVTNPFFVKTLQDWPHLIKINEFNCGKKSVNINSGLKKTSTKCLDMKTGVYTKYKPFLQKEREILKKLLKGIESKRPSEAQNALLRRFFIELTQSFLIPLERYFASLMPLAKNLSPFKRPPLLQHFKIEDFISTLDATGPQLTSGIKGDWTGLYRRFLRSPNFVCWYHNRMKEANDKLLELHLESICDSNVLNSIENKPEVEIVDLILKLKENIKNANEGHVQISAEIVERVKSNIMLIISKLPEDSRTLFGMN